MKIIDDEEYEKNKTFTIVLEEPILLEVGQRHGELKVQLNPAHQQQCGPINLLPNWMDGWIMVCTVSLPQETLTIIRQWWDLRTCQRWAVPAWESTLSWRWSSRSLTNSR